MMTAKIEEMFPPWVVEAFAECRASKYTGFTVINWRDGEVKHLEETRMRFGPKAVGLTPTCPRGCGSMSPRDHGAIWICGACGLKRTRAQLSQ